MCRFIIDLRLVKTDFHPSIDLQQFTSPRFTNFLPMASVSGVLESLDKPVISKEDLREDDSEDDVDGLLTQAMDGADAGQDLSFHSREDPLADV